MLARGLGLSLFCHLGAIGVARWWRQAAPGLPPPASAPPVLGDQSEAWSPEATPTSPVLVPLADCIAAAVDAGQLLVCPSPCTPGPACPEAGESSPSWTLQIGTRFLGLLFLEGAKLVLSLAGRPGWLLHRLLAGGERPQLNRGDGPGPAPQIGPLVDGDVYGLPTDFEELALAQARASGLRRLKQ